MIVALDKVVLHYRCPDCLAQTPQPLDDLNEVGIAFCAGCDGDMVLESVEIDDSVIAALRGRSNNALTSKKSTKSRTKERR